MTGFELTASLVGSLAWPVAVLAVVVVLRARIGSLLDRVRGAVLPGGTELTLDAVQAEVLAAEQALEGTLARVDLPDEVREELGRTRSTLEDLSAVVLDLIDETARPAEDPWLDMRNDKNLNLQELIREKQRRSAIREQQRHRQQAQAAKIADDLAALDKPDR